MTPKLFWDIFTLRDMNNKNFSLFTNFYNPSFTISIAEKKYKRNDIILFYEISGIKYVYSCSKPICYYGIKPGFTVNLVKKVVDNFYLLPYEEFVNEKNYLKNLLVDKLKAYAFSVYDIPSDSINPLSFDCLSIIADFSGCHLLYKPIFVFLDSIFKSFLNLEPKLSLYFITSNSFSFSLYSASSLYLDNLKNISLTFYKSNQFLYLIKLSDIFYPIKFFEEGQIIFFSDLLKIPISFHEKLLDLAISSSSLSSRLKLANRLKPFLLPFESIKKTEYIDLFIFKFIQRIFSKNQKDLYAIPIIFSPPTNNKEAIQNQVRKKLFCESYFLKDFWFKSNSRQIAVTVEYTNQSIDHFTLSFEDEDIFTFFKSICQNITLRLKSKSSVHLIQLEFDKNSTIRLFEKTIDNDVKLLSLFESLTQKFGDSKVHLAG